MTELVSWVVFPLVALVASLGAGLLAEWVSGTTLPPALVPPLGFTACVALTGPGYALGGGSGLAAATIAVAAGAGLWLGRRRIGARFAPRLGAGVATGTYAVYMAPVVLSGGATFLGYNLLNDTAVHLTLVDYVSEFGRLHHSLPASSFASAVKDYAGRSYPLGSHELLAALRQVVGEDAARVYQPYIAYAGGMAGAALFALLRQARAPAPAAGVAALLALCGQLIFSYDLQGGIKELTFLASLAALAGVGVVWLRLGGRRLAAVIALPAIAAYSIYGAAALAWLIPAAAALAGAAVLQHGWPLDRRIVRAGLAAVVVFLVLGSPTIAASFQFYREGGKEIVTSQSELGQLLRPLPLPEATGIWLNGDYRAPALRQYRWPNAVLIAVALALAAVGVAYAVTRRLLAPLIFAAPFLVALVVLAPASSPYIDAKLLALLSPAVVLFSCLGAAGLWVWRQRAAAALAGAAVVGGVVASDALAYRQALVAPIDRLSELSKIGERFEGRGPLLVNEFEEYAKHFAREARPVDPYEAFRGRRPLLRNPSRRRVYANAVTLDELRLSYVTGFPLIATRRSPAESRPPASYERVWSGRFYEVWRRKSGPKVLRHVPAGSPTENPLSAASRLSCDQLRRLGAGHDLIAALRPAAVIADLSRGSPLPGGWRRVPGSAPTLRADNAGTVRGEVSAPPGRYEVWLRGRTYRADQVLVDGGRAGTGEAENGSRQWIRVGVVTLRGHRHRVELRRPGASLAPGDGRADLIGPLALTSEARTRLVRVPRGRGDTLCGRSLDWVEQLAPGGAR